MSSRRDKPPAPIVTKTANGLKPVSGYDAERLDTEPIGAEFDLIKRSKRSNPQQGLYWRGLHLAVEATGNWPTASHLHEDLKLMCGFRRQAVDWETGEVFTTLDSTAFDAMTQEEFSVYFNAAQAKWIEHYGFDPWTEYLATRGNHDHSRERE